MATQIKEDSLNSNTLQSGFGVPSHLADIGTLFTDKDTGNVYVNRDGAVNWVSIASGGTGSGSGTTLNGTGFVKANGTTITYDNSSYVPFSGSNIIINGSITASSANFSSDTYINSVRIGKGNGNISDSTVLGFNALNSLTAGTFNTAIGYSAMANTLNTTSTTAVGVRALTNNTTGQHNTAIGAFALINNTTGGGSTENDNGGNAAVGAYSLFLNTVGNGNTAIGQEALSQLCALSGSNPNSVLTAITTASASINVAIGNFTGARLFSGSSNVYLGAFAGRGHSYGSNNILIGAGAGYATGYYTANNNVAIGTSIGSFANRSNCIVIGATAAVPTTDNTIRLGNTSITALTTSARISAPSIVLTSGLTATTISATTYNNLPNTLYTGDGNLSGNRIIGLGSNTLRFSGSSRPHAIFINSSGQVGINNNNPNVSLDISGSCQISNLAANFSSNILQVIQNNTTTSSSAYDAIFAFRNEAVTLNSFSLLTFQQGPESTGLARIGSRMIAYGGSNINNYQGNLVFQVRNGASIPDSMVLQYDGKLGIGTSSPTALLDVDGTAKIASGLTANTLTLPASASSISLTNSTQQQIRFFNGGVGGPTLSAYSRGVKIILSDNIDSSISTGYAIGVDAGSLWYGADLTGNGHDWYAGTRKLSSLIASAGFQLFALGGPTTAAMTISGTSALGSKGGLGYMDFLRVNNNYSAATNPNKWFRTTSGGTLEILRDDYNALILTVGDNGIVGVGGGTTATTSSNSATSNALNIGSKGQLFDDGNFHIHTSTGSLWINSLDGSAIRLGTQTNSGNSPVLVDTSTVGHSFFTKVQSGFNVAFGTEITMDNLKVRINGTGGTNGLVQAGAVSGTFVAYTTLLGNVAGFAVQGDTNSASITFTTTYQNISSAQLTLASGGDVTTLHLIDITNSRIYRITAIHCQGTTGGYTSIERMA